MRFNRLHGRRWAAAASAAALGITTLFAAAPADASESRHNHAEARTDEWNSSAFDLAFQVRQTHSSTINASNSADASSHDCDGCRGVAIAFQIVTDAKTPEAVNADNTADSTVTDCVDCQTVAVAYQFVVAKPTELTWQDKSQLYQIEAELEALRSSGTPISQISSDTATYAGQVASILANAGDGWWPTVHRYVTYHY